MFGLWNKKPRLPQRVANPGLTIEAKVSFANADRTWTEEVNLLTVAETVLAKRGYQVTNETTHLLHASGFSILPQILEVEPLDNGSVRTVTTVQISHPKLTPDGVFEFQHSAGDCVADSVAKGLDQWSQTDFVPLLEALSPEPGSCMVLQLEIPTKAGRPARIRRAILGPVAHFMQQPPSETDADEHSFCACCLLTKSIDSFKDLLEADEFYCLRFFAARDETGRPQADCRVNGGDWEPGAKALRKYAKTWPPAGYEFRKQYVVLQTLGT